MAVSTAQRAIAVVAKFKKVNEDSISLDTTFEQLGLDSLDAINLIFALEEEFKVTIPDETALQVKSVRQMVDGIDHLLSAQAG